MTKQINLIKIQQQNIYLGIDVSKGYADFVLLDCTKQVLVEPFQLDDNRKGHQALEDFLKSTLQQNSDESQLRCGLESTGGYENNWYGALLRLNKQEGRIQVSRVNPRAIHHSCKAEMQRTVTDGTSAKAIAAYLISYAEKVRYNEAAAGGNLEECKPLYTHIQILIKQQTQLKNQLEKLLYQGFPELLNLSKGKWPLWIWSLLEHYPTAGALAEAKGRLKNTPYANEDKLRRLRKQLCQGSVAGSDDTHLRFTVRSLIKQIRFLGNQVKELKGHLCKAAQDTRIDLLLSLPGVATYSACGILMEIGQLDRFADSEHLASFFGVHPVYKSSGDGKTVPRMSKQGSPILRSILYMGAKTAVVHDDHLKAIYQKHRQKGFAYNQAIGVIMHKMLRIIYGILSSGKPYNPSTDQHNRQKMINNQENTDQQSDPNFSDRKRRLQELSTEAPVSKIHRKKRELHLEPQNSDVELSTRSSGEA